MIDTITQQAIPAHLNAEQKGHYEVNDNSIHYQPVNSTAVGRDYILTTYT